MKKAASYLEKPTIYYILLACLGILSLFVHWLGFAFFTYALCQFITRQFKMPVVVSLFYTILILCAGISGVGFLLDFIAPDLEQFPVIYIGLILAAITYTVAYPGKMSLRRKSLVDRQSFIGLIMAGFTAAILVFPVLQLHTGSELIRFLSSGEDSASHYAMFQFNLLEESPPYFDRASTGLIPTLNIYPQGIQSFFAFTYWSILGDRELSVLTLLRLYSIMTICVAASLTFICSLLIQRLVDKRFDILLTLIGLSLIFIGVILFLMGWGFLTQIAALTYLLSIAFFLLSKPYNFTKKQIQSILFVFGMLVVGVTFSWYLMLPIAALSLLPVLLQSFSVTRTMTTFYVSITGIFVTLPILLNLLAGKGSSAINEPGGVYQYGPLALFVIFIGFIISLIAVIKLPNSRFPVSLKIFTLSSYLLSGLIGIYQLVSTSSLHYYFYKSLYLLLILGILAVLYIVSHILTKAGLQKHAFSLTSIGVVIYFTLLVVVIKPVYPQVYLNNWFNHSLDPMTISRAVTLRDTRLSHDVYYVAPCYPVREYTLNRWTGALFLSENHQRGTLESGRLHNISSDKKLESFIQSQKPTVVRTIVDTRCP